MHKKYVVITYHRVSEKAQIVAGQCKGVSAEVVQLDVTDVKDHLEISY